MLPVSSIAVEAPDQNAKPDPRAEAHSTLGRTPRTPKYRSSAFGEVGVIAQIGWSVRFTVGGYLKRSVTMLP